MTTQRSLSIDAQSIMRGKICRNEEYEPDLFRVRIIDMGHLPRYEIIWDSF